MVNSGWTREEADSNSTDRNIDAGIEADSLQIDTGIERFQGLLHDHPEPLRPSVLGAAGLADLASWVTW
jgi:hypothetical protein